ncbi:integrase/transposase/recombinase [Candidatus Hepatincola sp. Pdp]
MEEILELKLAGYVSRYHLAKKVTKESWLYRTYKTTKKDGREYHLSNFPSQVREKIVSKLLKKQRLEKQLANLSTIEKIERIAYARFEIVHYVENSGLNKKDFTKEYNNKKIPLNTYDVIENITERTLYRWVASYNKFGIEGLKSRSNTRRIGKVKSYEVKELVEGVLLQKPHLKVSIIYDFLLGKAKKEGFTLPTYKTIVRYINNFKQKNKAQFLLASNPDAFKNKYMLAIGSYSEEAVEPNYIWEVDSTPADIMLQEGRCTILGCVDIHTRRVKFLVQKSSNSLGITSLIRNCILDWGLPKIIKSDNGADYKSKQVEIALKILKIEQRFVKPYSGWEKPFVERVFRTVQHSHLEAHKDFIGHNVAQRKAIESIKSFAERLLNKEKEFPEYSIEDLQNFLNIWVNNYYLNRSHDGLNKYAKQHKLAIVPTPNSILQYSLTKGFKAKEPTSTRDLDLLLEPLAGKRTIGKKGIWVNNNTYFNPSLAIYVGNKVIIRVDRVDMGKVYVFDEGHNFICEAVNYELLGDSKFEFIRKGKAIQNELAKQLKRNTKVLINKAKGLPNYGNIQVDLEEAIREVETKDILNGTKRDKLNGNNPKKCIQEYLIEQQQEVDEGEVRYQKAKKLEMKLAHGEEIKEINWLRNYQKTGEYLGKEERNKFNNKELVNEDNETNSVTNN